MNAVQIVTIKNKIPLFKGEEQAISVEKIQLEENDFSLIAGKDLYQIGDKAIYIQPDYSLSEIELFDSFIKPNGDPKKSRLGSNRRIRAVKMNLHTGNGEPTYSVGILLPINEVESHLGKSVTEFENLTEALGVTKWEEPDNSANNGGKNGPRREFPDGMYKTDEENINNMWKYLTFPVSLIGTLKNDGSSITLFDTLDNSGICSRKLLVPMRYDKIVGRRTPNFIEKILMFFGRKPNLNIVKFVDSEDGFIVLGKPYLEKLSNYCDTNDLKLALRGEANGKGWKGSGNHNNPTSKLEPNIKFFGADDYSSGKTVKLGEESFAKIINDLGFERCEVIFNKEFSSKEELSEACERYFKANLVEGIVIRTLDSKFSAKYMNNEYDSKK
jgi:hypothetical protein